MYEQCSGHPDVRHSKCGGQLSVTGTALVRMPVGFGFGSGKDAGKFVVDSLEYKCYMGWCDKCQCEGTFIRSDRKPKKIRRRPRKLNKKILDISEP